MIERTSGDILRSDAEGLANIVNCVGVMGRGIALQFKKRFPANFEAYADARQRGEVQPGRRCNQASRARWASLRRCA